MKAEFRRILVWVGYAVGYLLALLVFAYLTFPYERLKERIITEFNAKQTGPNPSRLEVDEIGSYRVSGLEAEGVRLISQAEPKEGEKKPEEPTVTAIDSVHARLSLLNLLIFRKVIGFGASAFGGEISGSVSDSDVARTVDAEIEGLDLSELALAKNAVGLPLFGKLSGKLELETPEARLSKAEGMLALKIAELGAGDGKAKIRDTIALPRIDAGELILEAEVKAGQAKITKFSATGPDLEFVAEGSIRFRDQPNLSTLALNVRFKFTDRYANKNELTKALLGPTGLFNLDPKNKRAKQSDGFYAWRVSGTLGKPSFAPQGFSDGSPRSKHSKNR